MSTKNGSMAPRDGTKYKDKLGHIQKTLQSRRKENKSCPAKEIDGNVKNSFREHNQEADHVVNLGTDGHRKSTIGVCKEYRRMESCTWDLGR